MPLGKVLVIAGLVLVAIGALLWLAGNRLNWFGQLPGDIRVEKENFRFYMPVTSMILLSILLSALLWIIRKFL